MTLTLLLLVSCAYRPVPFTDADLFEDAHPGQALVHYLAQEGADPRVCAEVQRHAPLDAQDVDVLARGLGKGWVEPGVWASCVTHLRPRLGAYARQELDMRQARLYLRASRQGLDRQAGVLLELRGLADPPVRPDPRLDKVAHRLRKLDLGQEWLEIIDMEQGIYQGQTVDEALISSLTDEVALERLAARLPDETLRQACARRLVQLRVEASPFAELHGHPEVVDRVLKLGRNPVSLEEHPLRSARWIREAPSLWVEQDLVAQEARLLSGPPGALQPPLDLRQLFEVELEGVSLPVSACEAPSERDPSPCLLLDTDAPWALVSEDGVVHLEDQVPLEEAVHLGHTLDLGLRWREQAVGEALTLPVRFALPRPLVFQGGPDLEVRVGEVADRVVWKVQTDRTWLAVVEADEAVEFELITVGVPGLPGSHGMAGTPGHQGMAGMSAMCPSTSGRNGSPGGNGGPGGRGGNGHPGGPGGDVDVVVVASPDRCQALSDLALVVVESRGGPGGAGGQGGAGGRGGQGGTGGSGTSCYDYSSGTSRYLSGGTSGPRGMDGARGMDGSPGMPGPAGEVHIRCQ